MTNYRITSQPWQLKAAAEGTLGAIILPLPEGRISGSPETWPIKSLKCGFNESDRIYLAEEWAISEGGLYLYKSDGDDGDEYCSPEEMPPEAARHWFEVGDVRVVQMSDIDRHLCDRAALTDIPPCLPCGFEEWASIFERWNAAHPDYPWDADRWVIVLDLNIIENPMEETLKLCVRFAAEANFEVKLADVQAYAEKNGYDWRDKDEREDAIAEMLGIKP
jgi:hypothetical protein